MISARRPVAGSEAAGGVLLVRTVDPGDDGCRVDVAVSAWLGEPRARTQARLARGEVTVEGAPADKGQRLRAGQRVRVHAAAREPAVEPSSDAGLGVRYEDEHLLVVAKPAGMVVHAGSGAVGWTLVDELRRRGVALAAGPDPHRPGIVHRLDRGTSGLLVVAKSPPAHRGLSEALRARAVERVYWALVEGVPRVPRATVDAPVARSPGSRTRFTVTAGGRPAVSHYDLDEAHDRASALTVRLATGRTHQVRVHMAAIGHPLCGDTAYGASPALRAELRLERPALHARRLAFDHPLSGRRLALEEPLPDDLVAALALLRDGG